jgi:hypothetical protein
MTDPRHQQAPVPPAPRMLGQALGSKALGLGAPARRR